MEEFVMSQSYKFHLDGKKHEVSIIKCHPELTIAIDGISFAVKDFTRIAENYFSMLVNGQLKKIWWAQDEEAIYLRCDGRTYTLPYLDHISATQKATTNGDIIKATMPGIVVSVNCQPGSTVMFGDVLIVIESMKMQINITAPRDGEVESIHAEINSAFEKNTELIGLKAQQ